MTQPFRDNPKLAGGLHNLNRICTMTMYILYPLFLVYLLVQRDDRFLKVLRRKVSYQPEKTLWSLWTSAGNPERYERKILSQPSCVQCRCHCHDISSYVTLDMAERPAFVCYTVRGCGKSRIRCTLYQWCDRRNCNWYSCSSCIFTLKQLFRLLIPVLSRSHTVLCLEGTVKIGEVIKADFFRNG